MWQQVLAVKLAAQVELVEPLGGEQGEDAFELALGQTAQQADDAVAQTECLADGSSRAALVEEERVGGVEEVGLQVVPVEVEVAAQHFAVERHLHEVGGLGLGVFEPPGLCLAALEFEHAAAVGGHHVEPAAQSQRGTDEGGLEHGLFGDDAHIVGREAFGHGAADVAELSAGFVEEAGRHDFIGQAGVEEHVVAEAAAGRGFEGGLAAVVDAVVHELVGHVSQEDVGIRLCRPEGVDEIVERGVAVGFQTVGEGRDVEQVVGFEDGHVDLQRLCLAADGHSVEQHDVGPFAEVARVGLFVGRGAFGLEELDVEGLVVAVEEAVEAMGRGDVQDHAAQGLARTVAGSLDAQRPDVLGQGGRHGLAVDLHHEVAQVGQVGFFGFGSRTVVFVEHAAGVLPEAVGGAMVDVQVSAHGHQPREQGGVVALEVFRLFQTDAAEQAPQAGVAYAGFAGNPADLQQFFVHGTGFSRVRK